MLLLKKNSASLPRALPCMYFLNIPSLKGAGASRQKQYSMRRAYPMIFFHRIRSPLYIFTELFCCFPPSGSCGLRQEGHASAGAVFLKGLFTRRGPRSFSSAFTRRGPRSPGRTSSRMRPARRSPRTRPPRACGCPCPGRPRRRRRRSGARGRRSVRQGRCTLP